MEHQHNHLKPFVFIGGSADGKRMRVNASATAVTLSQIKGPKNSQTYKRQRFELPEGFVEFFAVDGMTSGAALAQLIVGYNPAPPPEPINQFTLRK